MIDEISPQFLCIFSLLQRSMTLHVLSSALSGEWNTAREFNSRAGI